MEGLQAIRDDIAATESLLDQAQAHYNEHRPLWTPDVAWELQAQIDRKRFELENRKLTVMLLEQF